MKQGSINKWITQKNKTKIFSLPPHPHLHSSLYSFLLNLFSYWLYMFIVLPLYDQKQDNSILLVEILGNFYLYLFIHILKKLWISIESNSTIKSDKPMLPWGLTVLKNPPVNAGDPGRSHMPQSNETRMPLLRLEPGSCNYGVRVPDLLKPDCPRAHAPRQEKPPQWEASITKE